MSEQLPRGCRAVSFMAIAMAFVDGAERDSERGHDAAASCGCGGHSHGIDRIQGASPVWGLVEALGRGVLHAGIKARLGSWACDQAAARLLAGDAPATAVGKGALLNSSEGGAASQCNDRSQCDERVDRRLHDR